MLFRRFELRAALEERDNKLTGSVESVSASEILSRAPDHMAEELCDAFRVEPPVLRESDIQASQEEAQVDVSHDPQRFILDRSSPFLPIRHEGVVPCSVRRGSGAIRSTAFQLHIKSAER